jgi:hypothetical protein
MNEKKFPVVITTNGSAGSIPIRYYHCLMHKHSLGFLQMTKDIPIAFQFINLKHDSFLHKHEKSSAFPLNNADIYYHNVSVESSKNYIPSTNQNFQGYTKWI